MRGKDIQPEVDVFSQFPNASDFLQRHLGTQDQDCEKMLSDMGESWESFLEKAIPPSIRNKGQLGLSRCYDEAEAQRELMKIARKNVPGVSMIGKGFYKSDTPAVLRRNILESPGWYTAYTPYQAEISQGRLEALMIFQTMVCELTAMEISNASLLDESSAAAEAMLLSYRYNKGKRSKFFVDEKIHLQTKNVLQTRAEPLGIELVLGDISSLRGNEEGIFGVVFQYPDTFGDIRGDVEEIRSVADSLEAMLVVIADPMALTLLKAPGEWGADIVVGSMQRFGLPMMFGGPHAGYMATKKAYIRLLPGRLIGLSKDHDEKPAYRMALQTREQHIRRDQATSNICTAQALPAIMSAMYAVYHGPEGLQRIAKRIHELTGIFAAALLRCGFKILNGHFFDTLSVEIGTKEKTDEIMERALAHDYYFWRENDTTISLSFDEHSLMKDIHVLYDIFFGQLHGLEAIEGEEIEGFESSMMRKDKCLRAEVFYRYRSETAMMRYLRDLKNKDLALDHTMIPLGSCTMKLNAGIEIEPVSWSDFANMHPFLPRDRAIGFEIMLKELEQMLSVVTGYDAVSLQPNAGSQGEVAGLLAIRSYHYSRSQQHRNICLVPESAHGTNPASVVLVGWKVVSLKHDEDGSISMQDLQEKLDTHGDHLAAIMLTYPSTYGVFDENVTDVCDLIHQYGGQVYIDGANMNAMVGLCKVGEFGGDVSHLNLHKTFCIPHGGGGPGVGAIGVRRHLKEFVPGHFWGYEYGIPRQKGALASAPFGSAGVMSISWMYLVMMGGQGLKMATERALLAANYIAQRLQPAYELLYASRHGLVAHECVIDFRPFKKTANISVDDVAKRLMDYGFHAPTVSFPVAGTMMVEPTESEPLEEIERFITAMLDIREEIAKIERGEWSEEDNPLKNAPHTAETVGSDNWQYGYSRQVAAWPSASYKKTYWPVVSRIDNVYGDKHIMVTMSTLPREETKEG